jgi:hypothetical protein
MFWFFERSHQFVRVEMGYNDDEQAFVVGVLWPDGREEAERFTEPELWRERLIRLENALAAEDWMPSFSPVPVPYGCPADAEPWNL